MTRAIIASFLALLTVLYAAEARAAEEEGKGLTAGQETILVEEGGALMPHGSLVIEPGFQYSHTSRTRISISGFTLLEAIVIGKIISEDVKRDIFMPFINIRAGITERVQLELKVPWMLRRDSEQFVVGPSGNDVMERRITESGLGDIEAGMNIQLMREGGMAPDLILNLKGKSRTGKDPYGLDTEMINGKERLTELPTGNGHYGASAGLTVVKSSDPAVFFGSGGYFYNFERNVGTVDGVDYGKIKPGDSVEFSFGMAYALNERLSSSISYQQRFTMKTEQNGDKIAMSDVNVASLYFGISYATSNRTAISISVGVGLTQDAPDATVAVRFPFNVI